MIKTKFESIFKCEMTDESVEKIMKTPFKIKEGYSPEGILNWKKYQPTPKNKTEDKALTCIYLKQFHPKSF